MTDEEIIRWFRHVEPPTSPHSFAELQSIKFPEFIKEDMERAYMRGVMDCAEVFLNMYRKGYTRSSETYNVVSRWVTRKDDDGTTMEDLHQQMDSWWAVRKKVLARCKDKCTLCGSTDELEIHHIVSVRDGGTPELKNLTAVCFKCHRERKDENTGKNAAIHHKRSA